MSGSIFQPDSDPRNWIRVALFRDKDYCVGDAEGLGQDKWFRQLVEHWDGEP
ncbi:MAG: hypothetical protein QF579_02935 [Dehalococcoidia bacterium]|jgi:hypothetical protein|nr:hypothetical protein [Dehalococcoidia bacterium]